MKPAFQNWREEFETKTPRPGEGRMKPAFQNWREEFETKTPRPGEGSNEARLPEQDRGEQGFLRTI